MGAVHLTFDNGPHPEGTPLVLKELSKREIAATFFVLGKELATPVGVNLAEQIRDEGHRLGNHSYNHETPLGEEPSEEAVERELEATQVLLDGVWTGQCWFRPFGGGGHLGPHLLSQAAVRWITEKKASCVLWNSVPGDWLDSEGWVEKALRDIDRQETSLVVLHDIVPAAMAHLGRFLDEVRARGHVFSDALPDECVPIRHGIVQPGLERFVR